MLELVSAKGDARPERQSSWLSSLGLVRGRLAESKGLLRLSFAGFVLLHFSAQAYRAYTDGALPGAGFEQTPGLVGAIFLLLWLPFTFYGLRQLSRTFTRSWPPASAGRARALGAVEPFSLALVLLFGTVHGWLMAWPLVNGSLAEADLRAELVASLSSTWQGVPVQGIAYLGAVGASSFCAARLTLAALPAASPRLVRAVISVAVLAYLLGSYAVIRCGSGSLLP